MMTMWKLVGGSVAVSLLGACSHTVREREVVQQPVIQPTPVVQQPVVQPTPVVQQPVVEHVTVVQPPPNRVDPVPSASAQPYPGARWVPGYWNWSGTEWVWVKGHWY